MYGERYDKSTNRVLTHAAGRWGVALLEQLFRPLSPHMVVVVVLRVLLVPVPKLD